MNRTKKPRKVTAEKRAAIERKVVSFTPRARPDDVRETGCREPTWVMGGNMEVPDR